MPKIHNHNVINIKIGDVKKKKRKHRKKKTSSHHHPRSDIPFTALYPATPQLINKPAYDVTPYSQTFTSQLPNNLRIFDTQTPVVDRTFNSQVALSGGDRMSTPSTKVFDNYLEFPHTPTANIWSPSDNDKSHIPEYPPEHNPKIKSLWQRLGNNFRARENTIKGKEVFEKAQENTKKRLAIREKRIIDRGHQDPYFKVSDKDDKDSNQPSFSQPATLETPFTPAQTRKQKKAKEAEKADAVVVQPTKLPQPKGKSKR